MLAARERSDRSLRHARGSSHGATHAAPRLTAHVCSNQAPRSPRNLFRQAMHPVPMRSQPVRQCILRFRGEAAERGHSWLHLTHRLRTASSRSELARSTRNPSAAECLDEALQWKFRDVLRSRFLVHSPPKPEYELPYWSASHGYGVHRLAKKASWRSWRWIGARTAPRAVRVHDLLTLVAARTDGASSARTGRAAGASRGERVRQR